MVESSKRPLVIVGGGTAGLSSTRAALSFGVRPTLICDGPIGGDCTFTGCVPSKSLLGSSAAGLSFAEAVTIMNDSIREIAAEESAEVLRHEGAEVIEGRGILVGPNMVEVGGERLEAEKLILGFGSSPVVPPIEGIDSVEVVTNHSLFELATLPDRLAIIGAGPIGCEMATAFARFGSKVTLFDGTSRVLASEEPAASEIVASSLLDLGVDLRLGSFVRRLRRTEGSTEVTGSGSPVLADVVLVATGRRPNVTGVGLERAGVEVTASGAVMVDDRMRTNVANVYAAGDVTALAVFTHAADEQARLAVGYALGKGSRWKYQPAATPRVTFTTPEVASVGVLESEAPKGSRVVMLPLAQVDRARLAGATHGFVKLIAAPRPILGHRFGGRLVGATIVAERAGEMIHAPTMAVRLGFFAGRLAQVMTAYPTWANGVQQAAGELFRDGWSEAQR